MTVIRSLRLAAKASLRIATRGPQRADIERLLATGLVGAGSDNYVPASVYLELLGRHQLGPGETECLCAAMVYGWSVCCDDRRARRILAAELGEERLCGSIGLLREAVRDGLTTREEALAAYEQMKSRGGFLPDIDESFFRS